VKSIDQWYAHLNEPRLARTHKDVKGIPTMCRNLARGHPKRFTTNANQLLQLQPLRNIQFFPCYHIPIGSMYGIYANIWGILMVNVTIYGIHGSYGIYVIHAVAELLISDFQNLSRGPPNHRATAPKRATSSSSEKPSCRK